MAVNCRRYISYFDKMPITLLYIPCRVEIYFINTSLCVRILECRPCWVFNLSWSFEWYVNLTLIGRQPTRKFDSTNYVVVVYFNCKIPRYFESNWFSFQFYQWKMIMECRLFILSLRSLLFAYYSILNRINNVLT